MTLNDYSYRLKKTILADDYIFYDGQEKPDQLPLALIPITAYMIASKESSHERIDNLFGAAQKRDVTAKEEIKELYDEWEVPELGSFLTPVARRRYRKLILMCLEDPDGICDILLKLIGRAYPESKLSFGNWRDLMDTISFAGYDVRNAIIAYLLIRLDARNRGLVESDNIDKGTWQTFKMATVSSLPIPASRHHNGGAGKETELRKILEGQYLSDYELMYMDYAKKEKSLRKIIQKESDKIACGDRQPWDAASQPSIARDIDRSVATFIVKNDMDKTAAWFNKNPFIKKRENFKAEEQNLVVRFLYEWMSTLPFSREELLSTKISPDDCKNMEAAWRKATLGGSSATPESLLFAGGIISALARRAYNSEYSLETLVSEIMENKDLAENLGQEEKLAEDLKAAKEELESEKAKWMKLSKKAEHDRLNAVQELNKKEEAYKKLKEDYNDLRKQVDDILAACNEEANEPVNTEVSLDDMIKEIRSKNLLFVGGHVSWQKAISEKLPDYRFIPMDEGTQVTKGMLSNIDCVIINVNYNKHLNYNRCLNMKKLGTRIVFVGANNVELTIRRIYDCVRDKKEAANAV